MRATFENICIISVCAIKYFKEQTIKIPPRLIVRKTKEGGGHKKEQNKELLQGSLSITWLQRLQNCV